MEILFGAVVIFVVIHIHDVYVLYTGVPADKRANICERISPRGTRDARSHLIHRNIDDDIYSTKL